VDGADVLAAPLLFIDIDANEESKAFSLWSKDLFDIAFRLILADRGLAVL
jgi:hypothetical protein